MPIKNYLQASSIATATATVILSLRVVTCADETHHLYAVRGLWNIFLSSCFAIQYPGDLHSKAFCHVFSAKFFLANTSFSVFIDALYRVLMCSRTGFLISSQNACNLHSALVFIYNSCVSFDFQVCVTVNVYDCIIKSIYSNRLSHSLN